MAARGAARLSSLRLWADAVEALGWEGRPARIRLPGAGCRARSAAEAAPRAGSATPLHGRRGGRRRAGEPALLAALVLLAALRSAVAWRREIHVAAMRHQFVDRLRERLFAATAEAAWPLLVRRRQSDLLHALTYDANRAGQVAMFLIQGRPPLR